MKRAFWLPAVVALLLLVTLALAHSSGHAVATETVAGGGYRLTPLASAQAQGDTWQLSGTASSPLYRLEGAHTLQSPGCCCDYLPCVFRSAP